MLLQNIFEGLLLVWSDDDALFVLFLDLLINYQFIFILTFERGIA